MNRFLSAEKKIRNEDIIKIVTGKLKEVGQVKEKDGKIWYFKAGWQSEQGNRSIQERFQFFRAWDRRQWCCKQSNRNGRGNNKNCKANSKEKSWNGKTALWNTATDGKL